MLIELFTTAQEVLSRFTKENMRFFDFRYFGKRTAELTEELKYPNSYFFKRLKELTEEFSDYMEQAGITEKRFENEFMKIDVIRAVAQAIRDKEEREKRCKKKDRLISGTQKPAVSKRNQRNMRPLRQKESDENYSKSFSS